MQGKSIPEIAKAMETVVGMNKASAVRNARTAMTGAQNAGRQQAYERAAAMGISLQKEWIATLDGRTRHSHGMADGQKVDINGMFKVGGCKMRYPGDVANGTAAEVYNCRCTMCTVEPPEIMQGEDERMTYSEWLQTKEGQEATGGKYSENSLDNGEKKNTTVSPSKISNNISSKQQTNFKTKSELEQMSIAQLRKETANLAKTWYESGKSGISFGDKDIDAVVGKLVTNANRNSLTKDYMSLKKKVAALDIGKKSSIIEIGKSLGASAKNYPVKLPDSNQHVKLAEGQTIVGKAFAGKGTNVAIKDRFRLESKFNVPADEWKKVSGKGKIIENGKEVLAELHWYEADGKIYEMKVKRYLDES